MVRRIALALLVCGLTATVASGFEDDVDVSADYPTFDGFSEGEEDSEDYLGPRARRGDKPPEVSPDAQWILGLGVLSNMQHFFENLRSNLESLESLPAEEKEALLGRAVATVGCKGRHEARILKARRPKSMVIGRASWPRRSSEQDRTMRPRATAAYLHALRNHRPSHKIRSFVSSPEPANLRGTNQYDPNYLWTGLGRRR